MQEYHLNWLKKHGVGADFLSQCLQNGFDIHHIDGDHGNNSPENLVLIYAGDHAILHGALRTFSGRADGVWMTREELEERKKTNGQRAYEQRASGMLWDEIDVPCAMNVAKFYAKHNGLEWPIQVKAKRRRRKAAKKTLNPKWVKWDGVNGSRPKRFLVEYA